VHLPGPRIINFAGRWEAGSSTDGRRIEVACRDYAGKGLSLSEIRRGRIHGFVQGCRPGGWTFTINSSYASGKPI
jgi:hypothetical protein